MNIKTVALGVGALICTAVLTSALVIGGYTYLNAPDSDDAAQGENATRMARWFSSRSDAGKDVQFVEIKNVIITLKGEGRYERYVQLELALTTYNEEEAERCEAIIPAIRGATVTVLSNRDYAEIRAMSVSELRDSLMQEYQKTLGGLKVAIPFHEVVISKLVFQ